MNLILKTSFAIIRQNNLIHMYKNNQSKKIKTMLMIGDLNIRFLLLGLFFITIWCKWQKK